MSVLEIVEAFGEGPTIFVGHSVSAMIGLLADLRQGCHFAAHVMVAPPPSYINDGDYQGGFCLADIESLLETLENNYLGWSSQMAPAIMGAPGEPALAEELTASFCRTDPAGRLPTQSTSWVWRILCVNSSMSRKEKAIVWPIPTA